MEVMDTMMGQMEVMDTIMGQMEVMDTMMDQMEGIIMDLTVVTIIIMVTIMVLVTTILMDTTAMENACIKTDVINRTIRMDTMVDIPVLITAQTDIIIMNTIIMDMIRMVTVSIVTDVTTPTIQVGTMAENMALITAPMVVITIMDTISDMVHQVMFIITRMRLKTKTERSTVTLFITLIRNMALDSTRIYTCPPNTTFTALRDTNQARANTNTLVIQQSSRHGCRPMKMSRTHQMTINRPTAS